MNPVLVEVWRGQEVESRHRGAVVIVGAAGETLFSCGDVEALVFPRSAIKLMQALPLLETGAADAVGLTPAHIALACASHNGEHTHTALVRDMLARLDLGPEVLACGADLPMYPPAAHELIRHGQSPGREHHNCSGKHSGMLTVCCHQHWDVNGYNEYAHPSQQAWRQVMSDLCGLEADHLPWDFDGCGLPALALPLDKLAQGYASFACCQKASDVRAAAMQRILAAIAAHPFNIAGSERACTRVIQASGGRVIVKTGAEGVFIGVIPERQIAFALKIDDGATRAAETALGGVLAWLQEPVAQDPLLDSLFRRQLLNSQGKVVGKVVLSDTAFTQR